MFKPLNSANYQLLSQHTKANGNRGRSLLLPTLRQTPKADVPTDLKGAIPIFGKRLEAPSATRSSTLRRTMLLELMPKHTARERLKTRHPRSGMDLDRFLASSPKLPHRPGFPDSRLYLDRASQGGGMVFLFQSTPGP